MESPRVSRITEEVRKHDGRLYAVQVPGGVIQIHRKMEHSGQTQFILALTHNWRMTGVAVDWGLEPILQKLKSMDTWLNDQIYQDMVKERERKEADHKRQWKNDIRARAADLRKDFALATNDINTASL